MALMWTMFAFNRMIQLVTHLIPQTIYCIQRVMVVYTIFRQAILVQKSQFLAYGALDRWVHEYVWRKPTLPAFNSLERGLMIWVCLSAYGIGSIVILEGTMTAAVYLQIFEKTAIPEDRWLIGQNFILQQDNVPIHTAKLIKDYFRRENIKCSKLASTESRSVANRKGMGKFGNAHFGG